MPTKVPKAGTRRSGQGDAAPPLGRPIVKNFEPTQRAFNPFLHGAGGSETEPADTSISRRQGMPGFSDQETYSPGDEEVLSSKVFNPEGEDEMSETLLRQFIRETLANNRTGAVGVWGRAPSDLDAITQRRPDLGERPYADEPDLVDEDEDEVYPDKQEFAAVGGGGAAAGGGSIAGYVLPLGKSGPTYGGKRKKPSRAVKGFKATHG